MLFQGYSTFGPMPNRIFYLYFYSCIAGFSELCFASLLFDKNRETRVKFEVKARNADLESGLGTRQFSAI